MQYCKVSTYMGSQQWLLQQLFLSIFWEPRPFISLCAPSPNTLWLLRLVRLTTRAQRQKIVAFLFSPTCKIKTWNFNAFPTTIAYCLVAWPSVRCKPTNFDCCISACENTGFSLPDESYLCLQSILIRRATGSVGARVGWRQNFRNGGLPLILPPLPLDECLRCDSFHPKSIRHYLTNLFIRN